MRLDTLVFQRGLCESRTRAAAYIRDGRVTVDGAVVRKPSFDAPEDAAVTLDPTAPALVSRAQQKLDAAMARFALDCTGLTVLDVGASTGGFTRCLLDRGAGHVYALDVGHGQLHPSLREDSRVTALEGVNARTMTPGLFPVPPDMAVMDVSFISQSLIYPPALVSRAQQKLDAAMARFALDCTGLTVLDVGASTGGFTRCLLDRGAGHVYALDVGHGQLHPSLREDSRVTALEGVNARTMTPGLFPVPPDMAVMDVSFISQSLIYPALAAVLRPGSRLVTLVKPQFEAGRAHIGKGGLVKPSDRLYGDIFAKLENAAAENGLALLAQMPSPVRGGDGNAEFLALFARVEGGTDEGKDRN